MLELNSNYLSFRLSGLTLMETIDFEHLLVFAYIVAVVTQSEGLA